MAIAIDTSVLIDVLLADANFRRPSTEALRRYAVDGLVICDVALAEIVPILKAGPPADFLRDWNITFSPSSIESSVLAGRMYSIYLERGGKRGRVVPDFLIAAHAQIHATGLLARDRGYYRDYFTGLKLIDPSARGS
jgi:predicted nucleic acid-binding protein